MRVNTALILCAGFGKRLNPLTLETPKPLIEFNNVSVLETCINLIEGLDVKEILINTFYLKDQIHDFINKKIDKDKLKNDFDILSVLRNLKIIGIFTRLAERDKKKKYLKLIPYAWKIIDRRMSKNKVFDSLKMLLMSNFSKFLTK